MTWTVVPLNAAVEGELMSLPDDMRARFVRIAELLEEFGPAQVGMPHVRPLGGKLWEMRLSGRAGIARAIYTAASRQRLIVWHAFIKKTQKTPERALDLARARLSEVEP